MSTIKKVTNKLEDRGLIKTLAEAYYNHYRKRGVCLLSEEVLHFFERVVLNCAGNILVTYGSGEKSIQGFLVGFPLKDYEAMTGIYNLSGNGILFSDDVYLIDSLIKFPSPEEPDLSDALLVSLPEYLRPHHNLKRIIMLISDNPRDKNEQLEEALAWYKYKLLDEEVIKTEARFTSTGIRKIPTRNRIFSLNISD